MAILYKDSLNSIDEVEAIKRLREGFSKIKSELSKVIVGQDSVIEDLLITMFAGGHCLLIGVPGLAKTLLISTLADILNLDFNRVQFTPDLMPSDITGTEIIDVSEDREKREFRFVKGPIFSNILLADEINRTPPKTQAALLQAMQEHQVTAAGSTYKLSEPFFVLATQNPIEQEGTYPLPEAQLDRFMFNIKVGYPGFEEEMEIVKSTTADRTAKLDKILDFEDIRFLQKLVRKIPVSDYVVEYAVSLVRNTRPEKVFEEIKGLGLWGTDKQSSEDKKTSIKDYISNALNWGAGPRASQYLILGAKAKAALDGRYTPECSDIRAVAKGVLRHRLVLNFSAEAENLDADSVIDKIIDKIQEPEK